jgi:hypothetical protein
VIYCADTSWWVNFLVRGDAHHAAVRAPAFLSFDADQIALAQAAGLDVS